MAVSEWFIELNSNWWERLESTKTPVHDQQDAESMIELVLKCIAQRFPDLNYLENASSCEPPLSKPRHKQPQESLLMSAKNWQDRYRVHHALELSSDSLMHFIPTGSLKNIFNESKNNLTGDNKLFNKQSLTVALDEFQVIRSAIAHNQPIAIRTIVNLDSLLRKLVDWATVFVDRQSRA